MKGKIIAICIAAALTLLNAFTAPAILEAGEQLRYSCSAQIYDAFEAERLSAFTQATGIAVDLYIAASSTCVNRLMNGFCDIASTTRGLHYSHTENGYVETPFCRDALAVVVHQASPVSTLSKKQLRNIFLGDVDNWRQLAGPDLPIALAIPGKSTGAYKNFRLMAMRNRDIRYDFMAYRSTRVIDLVKFIPGTISFIARGAIAGRTEVKSVDIDGISPSDPNYPLSQTFSYVSRGNPTGPAKAFVDFTFSDAGREIMKKKGLLPIQ